MRRELHLHLLALLLVCGCNSGSGGPAQDADSTAEVAGEIGEGVSPSDQVEGRTDLATADNANQDLGDAAKGDSQSHDVAADIAADLCFDLPGDQTVNTDLGLDAPNHDAAGDVGQTDVSDMTAGDTSELLDSKPADLSETAGADQLADADAGSADVGWPGDTASGDFSDALPDHEVGPLDAVDDAEPDGGDVGDLAEGDADLDADGGEVVEPTCEETCSPDELFSGSVCLWSGATMASFCAVRCSLGTANCASVGDCDAVAYSGLCNDICHIESGSSFGLGKTVPRFVCMDRNTNSPTYGQQVTDAVLRERVWVAYFGSCT